MNSAPSTSRLGLLQAFLACLIWGVLPVYFKWLESIPALEIVSHRVVWSVPLLLIILWFRKNLHGLKTALSDKKTCGYLLLTSLLIAANWLIYVWAVNENHILAASLGYFVSPLISVSLGWLVLKEKLSRNQWIAVAIAGLGVSVLAVQAWETLWISMALAGSWCLYSLFRKIIPTGPMVGLSVETGLLFPLFLGYLLWLGGTGQNVGFEGKWSIDLLLMGGAILTATPLLLFTSAVRKVKLTIVGLMQYVAPSLQFLIGVFVYSEPLSMSHIICFALIWLSLTIFSIDTFRPAPENPAPAR